MKKTMIRLTLITLLVTMVFTVVGCGKKEEVAKDYKENELSNGYEDNEDEDINDDTYNEDDSEKGVEIDMDIDLGDIDFSWGSDDYGKDGWVFTSTGTMKMEIPEGWEHKIALHETAMGVRSNSLDGDIIEATIKKYSSMIKDPAERTPENQAKQNNENTTITKDTWGNTDVWYRMTEWSDYTEIAGFAAYSEEEYVGFDIRSKVVNGTVEDFMKSDAWNTLRTTFELTIP